MSVRVSVIVPVYNAEKYLKECFDSLTAVVNFKDIEVIAVDDGSVDGSAAICDDYAERYDNFRVIHQQNAGVSAARNSGLDVASGEFIGFSDADDYVYPEIYKELLDSADRYGADISVCRFTKELKEGTELCGHSPGSKEVYRGDEIISGIAYKAMASYFFNSVYNKLFSSKIIKQNNIRFPVGKKYGEDRDFAINCLSRADCVSFSEYVGYFYRYVESSAVNRSRVNYVNTLLAQYHADLKSFSGFGIDKSVIEEKCGVSLVENYTSTFWVVDQRFAGRERLDLFKDLLENAEMRELFEKWYGKAYESEYKYNQNIMKGILRKDVSMIDRSIRRQKLSEKTKIAASKVVRRFIK